MIKECESAQLKVNRYVVQTVLHNLVGDTERGCGVFCIVNKFGPVIAWAFFVFFGDN